MPSSGAQGPWGEPVPNSVALGLGVVCELLCPAAQLHQDQTCPGMDVDYGQRAKLEPLGNTVNSPGTLDKVYPALSNSPNRACPAPNPQLWTLQAENVLGTSGKPCLRYQLEKCLNQVLEPPGCAASDELQNI